MRKRCVFHLRKKTKMSGFRNLETNLETAAASEKHCIEGDMLSWDE